MKSRWGAVYLAVAVAVTIAAPARAADFWHDFGNLGDAIADDWDALTETVGGIFEDDDDGQPAPVTPEIADAPAAAPIDADQPRYDRAWVTEFQQRLTRAGLNPGPIDGAFGQRTSRAVLQFQQDARLQRDGLPRPSVMNALRRHGEIVPRPPATSRPPRPEMVALSTVAEEPTLPAREDGVPPADDTTTVGQEAADTVAAIAPASDRPPEAAEPIDGGAAVAAPTEPDTPIETPAPLDFPPVGIRIGMPIADAEARLIAAGFDKLGACNFRTKSANNRISWVVMRAERNLGGDDNLFCLPDQPVFRVQFEQLGGLPTDTPQALIETLNAQVGAVAVCEHLADDNTWCRWDPVPNAPSIAEISARVGSRGSLLSLQYSGVASAEPPLEQIAPAAGDPIADPVNPRITPTRPSFRSNEPVMLTYSGFPRGRGLIVLVPEGVAEGTYKRAQSAEDRGAYVGRPMAPGRYEARGYAIAEDNTRVRIATAIVIVLEGMGEPRSDAVEAE